MSFVVLFQELALIRWIPGQVRVAAYFPNLVLIAAFLGLGIGSLRARYGSLHWLWPASLVVLVGAVVGMGRVAFTGEETTEFLWLLYNDLPESAPVVRSVRLPLVLLFVLSALTFVAPGQIVARRLNRFREDSTPLKGYALDLGGSLAGVVAFAVLSFSGAEPWLWFAGVGAGGVLVLARRRRVLAGYLAAMALVLVAVAGFQRGERYSPYYALSTVPSPDDSLVVVRTNGSLHQIAFDVEGQGSATGSARAVTRQGYHLPYRALGRPPGKVLVLGAGTGNDIAVALQEGAREVHAVEIDPEIISIGREMHPNDPYADPRVRVIPTDARSYLNHTDETYDLIVFGTLDSMTRLSALSAVRLENFVYTRNGLEAAARRLEPDGGMVLYFRVGEEFIRDHITLSLYGALGEMPAMHVWEWNLFNSIFMVGPAFAHLERPPVPASVERAGGSLRVPSDDWPYLYLPNPGVNGFYLSLMAIFLVISAGAVAVASPAVRESVTGGGADWEMFLYGLAFLLMETHFITEMNLAWGATWLTSAVVFGSILATVLAVTLLVEARGVSWRVAAPGLLLSLGAAYLVPTETLLAAETLPRLALSLAFVGLPISFAAVCFALRFRVRASLDRAFGWNVLGAVVGGLAEFFTMALGMKALVLIAVAAYLGTFLLALRSPAASRREAGAVIVA